MEKREDMNILEINTVNFGSTGNIMIQIAEKARAHNHKVWIAYPKIKMNKAKSVEDSIAFGGEISRWIHLKLFHYFGLHGFGSFFPTIKLIKQMNEKKINLVHLHNLHNCYINIPLLFAYLRKKDIPIIWTLHDCWAFTGQCAHYDMIGCQKWKFGCGHCPQIHVYPASWVDRTRFMWKYKKRAFNSISRMMLIAPSQWMAEQAGNSFLQNYPIRVIRNGIDISTYDCHKPKYEYSKDITGKSIILGVAFKWGVKKGLDVFVELATRLDKEKYQIVLVGTDEETDGKLPECILSIHRTQNQNELAAIYSSADVFVNPTREEVLGLVNLEALACGTPVVTFASGGSPECIDETCGSIVPRDDINAMEKEILRICETKPYLEIDCINRARKFSKDIMLSDYIKVYEEQVL